MSLSSIPYHAFESIGTGEAPAPGGLRLWAAAHRRGLRTLGLMGALFGLSLLGAMLTIGALGYSGVPRGADVMLVLGNKVNPDGQPSPTLRRRLERAAELYAAGFTPTVIVSGGHADGFEEAYVMRDFLVAHGVPASAVVADTSGIDTYSSARFTAKFLADHSQKRVLVVSQFFHLPRAALALNRFGVTDVCYAAAHGFNWYIDLRGLAREVPGYLYYAIRAYPA